MTETDSYSFDKDFCDSVASVLKVSTREASDLISKVSVDQVLDLIDAVNVNDESRVESILKSVEETYSRLSEGTTSFVVGDTVKIKSSGKNGSIKISHAPNDMIGVTIDGVTKMFNKNDIELTEGQMATQDKELKRIMELSGIGSSEDFGMVPELTSDETAVVPMDDTSSELASPVDTSFDFDYPELNTAETVDQTDSIFSAMSDIESMLGNMKVSEYKQVVARLNDLVAKANSIGRSALAEKHASSRRSLKNYLGENNPGSVIGNNQQDAIKSIHDRIGGKPQDRKKAENLFKSLKSGGKIKQMGSEFKMDDLGEDEFNAFVATTDN